MLSVGLMSGTSMDGIDAALLETDGNGVIKELGHTSISYDPQFKILLKAAEYAVKNCKGNLDAARKYFTQALKDYLTELKTLEINISSNITELSSYLHGSNKSNIPITLDEIILHSTHLHGVAVKQLLKEKGYDAKQIDVVGYHGQTLYHRPYNGTIEGITVQAGDGQYLADQAGIAVINDFRSRDVAAHGQGAPFAPLYHQALAIRDNKMPLAVVNCGGIANITLINSSNALELIGFDTGPGNGLIDRLIKQKTNNKEFMDADGKYGIKGKVNNKLLEALFNQAIIKDGKNYFQTLPPKSLDINDMKLIPELFSDSLSLEDACRTLEAFTAETIVKSLELVNAKIPQHWILAGGGWKNPVIRQELEQRLSQKFGRAIQVQTADEAGWNSQALEAQIFAYLAVRSLQNQPISVPGTTHVSEPLSGGHAYIPRSGTTKTVNELIKFNPDVLNGYQEKN